MECDAKQGKMIGINFLFVSVFFSFLISCSLWLMRGWTRCSERRSTKAFRGWDVGAEVGGLAY